MATETATITSTAERPRHRRGALVLVGLASLALSAVWLWPHLRTQRESGLSEADAKYLQDAEHLGGFVLGDLTVPKITRAIEARDNRALSGLFAENFVGKLLARDAGKREKTSFALFERWRETTEPGSGCDADEMVDWLITLRDEFATLESISLKVKLMQPVTPGQLDGPWQGTLRLRLTGLVADGSRREIRTRFRCRLQSLDDELPEQTAWLAGLEAFHMDVVQSASPLMTDMTTETGILVERLQDNWVSVTGPQIPFLTGGVYLADYDGDGQVDCLLTDINGLALYRGLGNGRFADVTTAAGLPRNHTALQAAWADFDNDGDADLILGTELYQNFDGSRFVLVDSQVSGLSIGEGTGFAVADVDRDGLLDLYLVGLDRRTSGQKWIGDNDSNQNQLWRNRGGLKFTDVTSATGTAGRGASTFAAVFFDANADGWPDLMTACEFGANDFLLNNQDGTFRPAPLPEIYGGFSMGLTVGDIDNDGLGDPYLANMYSKAGERIVANLPRDRYAEDVDRKLRDFVTGSELYHNTGKGQFKRIGQTLGVSDVGWAYGPAYVDLDNDGRLDIYAPAGFQSITPERPDG